MTGGDFHTSFSTSLDELNEKIPNKKRKDSNDLVLSGSILNQAQHDALSSMVTSSKQRPISQKLSSDNQDILSSIDNRFSATENNQKYPNHDIQVGIPFEPLIDFNKNHLTDSEGTNSNAYNNTNRLDESQQQLMFLNVNSNLKHSVSNQNTICNSGNISNIKGSKLKLNDGKLTGKLSNSAKSTRNKKTKGRVKIKMEYIENKIRRYTTFSKRKTGIMKKAYELSTLTGTQVMLLVASETGHVYTFATDKLQPMITSEVGKNLIQSCLSQGLDEEAGCSSYVDNKISIENYNENDLEEDEFGSNNFDEDESDDQ